MGFFRGTPGSVNVLIIHIIFHLQIFEGDVKPIPKKGRLPGPEGENGEGKPSDLWISMGFS